MNKLWKGKEATHCDGSIFGYSRLSNVVFNDFKRHIRNKSKFGIM